MRLEMTQANDIQRCVPLWLHAEASLRQRGKMKTAKIRETRLAGAKIAALATHEQANRGVQSN